MGTPCEFVVAMKRNKLEANGYPKKRGSIVNLMNLIGVKILGHGLQVRGWFKICDTLATASIRRDLVVDNTILAEPLFLSRKGVNS
jgi:hypothetical protein